MYYLCYFPCPLYFFQVLFLCLFLGRDRTEYPIDVLFFTASRLELGNPFAFFNSSSSVLSYVSVYCGGDGDVLLSSE